MFLALHGQTEWNSDGRVQGWLDSPLTEHGLHQARPEGERPGMITEAETSSDRGSLGRAHAAAFPAVPSNCWGAA